MSIPIIPAPHPCRRASRSTSVACSYKIEAKVKIGLEKQTEKCSGVIFAHGSRFGGHSLFIGEDSKLHYVYNFLGIADKQYASRIPQRN